MEKNLVHLSEDEIQVLMQRYYNGENVAALIKEYRISTRASELYKLFPPQICENYECEYCGEYLVIDRVSKSVYGKTRYERELYCPECGHRPFIPKCECEYCLEAEEVRKEYQQVEIWNYYSKPQIPVEFDALSFENKVFLGTLCRALLKENLYEIIPYRDSNVVLAPSLELCKRIYDSLLHTQAISVSPDSPLDAFVTDSDVFPQKFYKNAVEYYLNLAFPENKDTLFFDILEPKYFREENAEEAMLLWKQIAVDECIEYLLRELKAVNFDFNPGDKTHKTFDIILNDFSVAQIYYIIGKAVRDATKLYLEKRMSKKHAANTVISICASYAERVKLNGWEIPCYKRVRDLPQSELSAFFFNRVLGIGDKGFNTVPSFSTLTKIIADRAESEHHP